MAEESEATEAPPTEEPSEDRFDESQGFKLREPSRTILFRHWSRPTSFQYDYNYDYRRNYYNDVIDYLDTKVRGLNRELPRAQTWAERALRTYAKDKKSAAYQRRHTDADLLNSIRNSNNHYKIHSRDYLIKRYPALGL
jgi:hypothetical protein